MIDLPVLGGDVCAKLDAAKAAYDGAVIQGLLGFAGSLIGVVGIFGALWFERRSSAEDQRRKAAEELDATIEAINAEVGVIVRSFRWEGYVGEIESILKELRRARLGSPTIAFAYIRSRRSITPVYSALVARLPLIGPDANTIFEFYSCVGAALSMSETLHNIEQAHRAGRRFVAEEELERLHSELLTDLKNVLTIGDDIQTALSLLLSKRKAQTQKIKEEKDEHL